VKYLRRRRENNFLQNEEIAEDRKRRKIYFEKLPKGRRELSKHKPSRTNGRSKKINFYLHESFLNSKTGP
jgi:DNA-binding PadR family transcriptional regulator